MPKKGQMHGTRPFSANDGFQPWCCWGTPGSSEAVKVGLVGKRMLADSPPLLGVPRLELAWLGVESGRVRYLRKKHLWKSQQKAANIIPPNLNAFPFDVDSKMKNQKFFWRTHKEKNEQLKHFGIVLFWRRKPFLFFFSINHKNCCGVKLLRRMDRRSVFPFCRRMITLGDVARIQRRAYLQEPSVVLDLR